MLLFCKLYANQDSGSNFVLHRKNSIYFWRSQSFVIAFKNGWHSIERWAIWACIINVKIDLTRSQTLRLEWQSECKHCTCQLITGPSVWQQSCLEDGQQLLPSQGKYLALLLYSQDSLYRRAAQRRICQEVPFPLPTKSFNRGLNLLNQTAIDLGADGDVWEQCIGWFKAPVKASTWIGPLEIRSVFNTSSQSILPD